MNHQDHVNLIRDAIPTTEGIWADLGSGDGAFTLAFAELNPVSEIYSIDKDTIRLERQKKTFRHMFPDTRVQYFSQDFTKNLDLPKLDGVIMANSLHFLSEKKYFLQNLRNLLKEDGRLVLIEYNVDNGNEWVPYPVSYKSFHKLCTEIGFTDISLVSTIPSGFLREIYCALAYR